MVDDPRQLAAAGLAALRQSDPLSARRHFEKLEQLGVADASIHFAKSIACRQLNDQRAALTALNVALLEAPSNFQYLLAKADVLIQLGEARAASQFYLTAVRAAADGVPPELQAELDRARKACTEFSNAMAGELARTVEAAHGELPRRVMRALDYLAGQKKHYPSQPRYFHFPELPSREFHTVNAPWVSVLESATDAIEAELRALMARPSAFMPYLAAPEGGVAARANPMVNNPDWSACYLWRNGEIVNEVARLCPQTMEAVNALPLCRIPRRSPSVLFSLMRPHAHIPPHNGLINTRLIGHLPLIVPPGCRLRVGNTTRTWERGKVWLFDDTIEHEAWNDSGETRVILLFEVARDDVAPEEHAAVGRVFEAVDKHAGVAPTWEI